jgi:hypothetical protein
VLIPNDLAVLMVLIYYQKGRNLEIDFPFSAAKVQLLFESAKDFKDFYPKISFALAKAKVMWEQIFSSPSRVSKPDLWSTCCTRGLTPDSTTWMPSS